MSNIHNANVAIYNTIKGYGNIAKSLCNAMEALALATSSLETSDSESMEAHAAAIGSVCALGNRMLKHTSAKAYAFHDLASLKRWIGNAHAHCVRVANMPGHGCAFANVSRLTIGETVRATMARLQDCRKLVEDMEAQAAAA